MTTARTARLATGPLATLLVLSCGSCRQPSVDASVPDPPDRSTPAATDAAQEPPARDLPVIDPGMLGLDSADPAQRAVQADPLIGVRKLVMAGDYDEAEELIASELEENPGGLEATLLFAGLLGRTQRPSEAVDAASGLLARAYPLVAHRLAHDPGLADVALDADSARRLEDVTEATRLAWADTVSGAGAYVLVAPAYDAAHAGDPDTERMGRGWVVYLDAATRRFLPLTHAGDASGFLLDRVHKRLYVIGYSSGVRATMDGDDVIRPALLMGVRVSYVDLTTFERSREVSLGDDVVSVRLSARSGLLLAAVERVDPGDGEPETSHLLVDFDSRTAEPAAEAAPGPMDLVLSHDDIEPPHGDPDDRTDPDRLPSGTRCVQTGDSYRLCSVPSRKGSVLSDLVLDDLADRSEDGSWTVAEALGILEMDVL